MGSFKPLFKLAGLPLIERAIATAANAGLEEFYVVTGNQAERLESFLHDLCLRRGVEIKCIRNPEWESGNGASLLQAEGLLGGSEFVLLMADHVLDESIIEQVMQEPLGGHDVTLAVDSCVHGNELVDPEDVTKVFVEQAEVRAIGKDLACFNAFDTGVFRCSSTLFRAARDSIEEGDASLSGAIRLLARQGRVRAIDIVGRRWADVDTPADAKKAEAVLYGDLRKALDGPIAAKLNRPVSTRLLTPLLLRLWSGITANQVSFLGFAVALAASLAFFLGSPFLGGLLIHMASLMDGSDGEVARLKKLQSAFGGFLDAVLDRYSDGFILFGMFYYAWSSPAISGLLGPYAAPVVLSCAIPAIAGNFMISYTSAKSVTDFGYRYKGGWIAAGKGRDLRLFLLTLGGIGVLVHPATVLPALALVGALTSAVVIRRLWLSWEYSRPDNWLATHRPRAVIFDFDGTIADTMTYLADVAVGLLTQHYGVSAREAHGKYIATTGLDFGSQLEQIFPRHPQNESVAAVMEERKRCQLLEHGLFPDVVPALAFLQDSDIRTFVCSSTRESLVHQFISKAGIEDLIDGSYGLLPGFPKPSQIEFVLTNHGLDPAECLFVGDSLADYEFASRAGMRFVGVSRLLGEEAFRSRGLTCVRDLAALIRPWQRWSDYIQQA